MTKTLLFSVNEGHDEGCIHPSAPHQACFSQEGAIYKEGRRSTKEGALQSSKIHITLFVELFKANMKI